MIALFDHARQNIATRPLWLFLALLLVVVVVERFVRRGTNGRRHQTFAQIASLTALAYYMGVTLWYVTVPQQVDYAEPTMTSVAWLFRMGQPIYHAIDSAARYSHMYGPMAFAIPAAALWLFGPSMFVAKAVGVVSAWLALGLLWMTVRSATRDTWLVILACGLCVLQFLAFRNLTFWSRPEPLQLVAVTLGLFAATRLSPITAVMVLSLSMGLLWNLKITGPLYSLPILALLWTRTGMMPVASSILGAGIVAALPFGVLPNVSLHDYLLWVGLSAQNGLRVAAMKENIEWGVFGLLPILARLTSPTAIPRQLMPPVVALFVGMIGVTVAASKPGAGAYHIVPFLPVIAYLWVRLEPETKASGLKSSGLWLAPYVATLVLAVILQQEYFLRLARDPALEDTYRDVAGYLEKHPGERIGMGYTSAEAMTFARPLIVFKTGEYLLDAPAIQEHQLSGLALPQATVDAMRGCSVRTWLLPRGDRAFHIRNGYPQTGYVEIFPQAFVDAFHQHYVLETQTQYYDVWRCRAGGS